MTDTNEEYAINFSFSVPETETLERFGGGFNEHGVRENDDGSVDFIFRAMEAGTWNNGRAEFHIPEGFLRTTANYSYNRIPIQLDHDTQNSVMSNVGWIKGDRVWFRDDALGLVGHIPNTGNQTRSDVIADFTNDPPAIQDGSIQFDPRTVDAEFTDDETVRINDGRIMEFSLTHFPSAYGSDGGLSPAFSLNATKPERSGTSRLSTKPKTYRITER